MSNLHKDLLSAEIHISHAFEFASVTAMEAASVVAADVGKIAKVTADDTYFLLTDDSPIKWMNIGDRKNIESISSSATIKNSSSIILVDASGGAVTVTLPAAANLQGKVYYIIKTDSSANTVTIDPNASETLDGETTVDLFSQFESKIILCDASNWLSVGGGGGSGTSGELNFYTKGDAETATLSDLQSGNNATFKNGGSLAGALSLLAIAGQTARGIQSYRYTAASSGSLNDWFGSSDGSIPIPLGYRERSLALKFQFRNSYSDDSVSLVIYDQTNATVLKEVLMESATLTSGQPYKEFNTSFFCPKTTADIIIGFQVKVDEGIRVFDWDDVIVNANPFVFKNLSEDQYYSISQPNNAMTDTSSEVEFNLGTATFIDLRGPEIITASDDSSNTRTKWTANKDCKVGVRASGRSASTNNILRVQRYNAAGTLLEAYQQGQQSGASLDHDVFVSFLMEAGEFFTMRTISALSATADTFQLSFVATAETAAVVSPLDNVLPAIYESNAGNSVGDGTTTYIDFEDKVSDPQNLVTTGGGNQTVAANGWKYTCPGAGIYSVKVSCDLIAGAWDASDRFDLAVTKNGTTWQSDRRFMETTFSDPVLRSIETLVQAEKGDELQFTIFQSSGAALNQAANAQRNRISIHKIDQNATLGFVPANIISIADGDANALYNTSVTETVEWRNIRHNPSGSLGSNGEFTCSRSGVITASGQCGFFENFTTGQSITVALEINSVQKMSHTLQMVASPGAARRYLPHFDFSFPVEKGDVARITMNQNSGTNHNPDDSDRSHVRFELKLQ